MSAIRDKNPVRLRRTDNIGYADAESDEIFLRHCFVETGDLKVLKDCADPRCIILGRTGSGKTALLKRLREEEEHCFEISPEHLSLGYIANSNVIEFFEALGVSLDIFYKLLWNHVISVELIQRKFAIYNETKKNDFLSYIKNALTRDRAKERAIAYLEQWGGRFWEETEHRVKSLTDQIESSLKASAEVKADIVGLGAEGVHKLTQEQKTEIVSRGRKVVDSVQIRELINVIELLADEVFNDAKNRHYLVIDRLDEGWADDRVRYRLIKALIESIKTFKRIRSVKVIVALRSDLKDRVMAETSSAGFQEEKYRSLYLNLGWSRGDVRNVLDSRVNYLFEHQYTRHNVFLKDVLPTGPVSGRSAIDYIIDRTFMRPREAIIFLNQCIEKAEGEPRISIGNLRAAEISYSKERLTSLCEEWNGDYPLLRQYTKILEHEQTPIAFERLHGKIDDFCAQILGVTDQGSDPMYAAAKKYLEDTTSGDNVLRFLLAILYKVGVIGIKPDTHLSRQWSYIDDPTISGATIRNTSTIEVHLTFWPVLGVSQKK